MARPGQPGRPRATVDLVRFMVATYRRASFPRALFLYRRVLSICGPVWTRRPSDHGHRERVVPGVKKSGGGGARTRGDESGRRCQASRLGAEWPVSGLLLGVSAGTWQERT